MITEGLEIHKMILFDYSIPENVPRLCFVSLNCQYEYYEKEQKIG